MTNKTYQVTYKHTNLLRERTETFNCYQQAHDFCNEIMSKFRGYQVNFMMKEL